MIYLLKGIATSDDLSALPQGDELGKHLADLDRRLQYAQAEAAQDYDQGREELAAHHGKMDTQVAALRAKIARLDPVVEKFLHGDQSALDEPLAKKCLQYLELQAQLNDTLAARRMAFGATQPPGAVPPGAPLA